MTKTFDRPTRRRYGRMALPIPILIALAIAAFGAIKFFTSSQPNPVTGEK